jgi:uncharacterized membrane protein HdeD (DUF308 family)
MIGMGCRSRIVRVRGKNEGVHVFILGLILLVVGYVTGISILYTVGMILLVVGLILLLLGHFHGPVAGGRRYWF